MYSVVDLFAGAGGLSLGFTQTGNYKVVAAFEKNEFASKTYKKNNPDVELYDDVCAANYNELKKKFGNIDIVIGGPPCQGFSNANRQHNTTINQNNMLVKQYIRAILELNPKAFVMENVGMLKSDVHKFYKTTADIDLIQEYGIETQNSKIFLLSKEYFFQDIYNIVNNLTNIDSYIWNDDFYLGINVIYKQKKNKTKLIKAIKKYSKLLKMNLHNEIGLENKTISKIFNNFKKNVDNLLSKKISIEDFITQLEKPLMIQKMFKTLKEIKDNNLVINNYSFESDLYAEVDSFPVYEYLTKILESKKHGYVIDKGILTASDFGVPQKRRRFVVMGIKRSISREVKLPENKKPHINTVKDAIYDIEDCYTTTSATNDNGIHLPKIPKKELSELARKLRNTNLLFNNIITDTGKTAMERFKLIKQGQNFHSLDNKHKKNTYANIERTQNTIYLRLDYSKVSGTVVNVRKSMWIHPTKDRALSVREAARLQTFPDSFIFCGSKDSQYQQVGNAVPPMLAEAISRKLLEYLNSK